MSGYHRIRTFLLAGTAVVLSTGGAAAQSAITLDMLTITAGKTSQSAIDALAGVSYMSREDLEKLLARIPSDALIAVPGVVASPLGNDPGAIVSIRGLQNFGRVAITVDGARQDFSRNSHAGNGSFYIEPELMKSVTVVRGTTGNSYGSGAIGGVVAFETIDAEDVLRDGERWALSNRTGFESNGGGLFSGVQGAARFSDAFEVVGGAVYRKSKDYENASGQDVPFTGQEPVSGLAKATFRPADGHEVEVSGMHYDNNYLASRSAGLAPAAPFFASVDDVDTSNTTVTGKWTYSQPDDNLFDFSATAYWNRTLSKQVKVFGSNSGSSGNLGDHRQFDVNTVGFDVHNSSRTEGLGFDHKFTYGVDYFLDDADSTSDLTSSSPPKSTASTTGSGKRGAGGAFLQWEGNHDGWLDLLAALRYDAFNLKGLDADGDPVALDGGRLSPKATIGITPKPGFTVYGTYAEGYRAPSITETFVGGTHQNDFAWVPNANLRPETARTFEVGANFKFDDLITAGDAFRAKVSAFRTSVDDYIDTVSGICLGTCPPDATVSQYQNVGEGRITGFEIEGTYDAGWSYLRLAASHAHAVKVSDGSLLNAGTPETKVGGTIGFRNAARTWDYGAEWRYASATDSALGYTDDYSLINLFANWTISPSASLSFGVDNVFNTSYTDALAGYIVGPPYSTIDTNGRGRTFKIALTSRIGG